MATFVNSVAPCSGIVGGCPNLPTTLGPVFKSLQAKWPLAVPLVNSTVDCSVTPTPNECISQDGWGNGDLGVLPAYPVPIYGQANESQSAPIDQYRWSLKFDHNFSSKDRLSGTYLLENVHATLNFGGGDNPFSPPLDNPNRAQTLGVSWTHTLSPTVLNQFKIGYVRRTANFTMPGTTGIPEFFSIDPTNVSLGSGIGIPQFFTENEFQYKDDVSVTHGKHQIKFGGEDRRTRNGSTFSNDAFGHFATWAAEGLVTDGLFTDAIDNAYYGGVNSGGYGGWYYA